jgi:carboxypeptidase family protein
MVLQFKSGLMVFALLALGYTSPCFGQTTQQPPATPAEHESGSDTAAQQPPDQPLPGSVSGTIVDRSGAVVAGAKVRLATADEQAAREALSGTNGQFSFTNVPAGPFQLTITAAGFSAQTSSGILRSGEVQFLPLITLDVAAAETDVNVVESTAEVAEDQIKEQEKQRVLRVIPNFYVTYIPDAAPLDSKQKFELAWKTIIDPISFGVIGAVAGIQQAQNDFAGYGQGAQGYAKRYGASYADFVAGTLIGSAVLPSVLKQDPRYFYKGGTSKRSRILYALANAAVCKGDNGRWQPNYSSILGNLAAGGLSNLYYPAQNRNGARLTFENAGIGIGTTGVVNLFEEFLVRKLTPNVPNHDSSKP